MSIMEYYKRQKRYKKFLFLIYTGILTGYVVAWIILAFILRFTLGDHIAVVVILLYWAAWGPIWFEVEPTEEEKEAIREECRKMLKEYDEKYVHPPKGSCP